MTAKIKKWAFVQPGYSRHMSEYYSGILAFLKDYPYIFLDTFSYAERALTRWVQADGIITYALPPADILNEIRRQNLPHPPVVAITTRNDAPAEFAIAHIDPAKVAEIVVAKFIQRHCHTFAFCSCHSEFQSIESAQLLRAYRRVVWEKTGTLTHLYRPKVTTDMNLIPDEMRRFVTWFKKQSRPCGMFVHGDDVAKKMLDTCRLHDIDVPSALRVIGTGNSPIFCENTIPTLSSYAVDHEKVGFNAARALFQMTEEGVSPQAASFEVSVPQVIERASTLDDLGRGRLADMARIFIHDQVDHGNAPTVMDIAHHFNVSRAKIQNDFREAIGHSLHDELASYRLKSLARALRHTTKPIKQLLLEAGFSSVSQANRAFKASFGVSMRKYRGALNP